MVYRGTHGKTSGVRSTSRYLRVRQHLVGIPTLFTTCRVPTGYRVAQTRTSGLRERVPLLLRGSRFSPFSGVATSIARSVMLCLSLSSLVHLLSSPPSRQFTIHPSIAVDVVERAHRVRDHWVHPQEHRILSAHASPDLVPHACVLQCHTARPRAHQ